MISQNIAINKNSILRRLDARARLVLLVILVINTVLLRPEDKIQSIIMLTTTIILAIVSGHKITYLVKRLIVFYPMVLLFTLPLLISSITTNPATSNSTYFSIDTARLYLFIIVQFKYIFSLVVVFSITACTSSREAIKVFEYFHFPVWMLAILHYIDQLFRVLSMEFERIRIAYLSRSIKTGLVLKLRTVIGLIYVYTIRIIERSERIFLAMLSRGFNGKFYTDEQLNWRWGDSIIIASCVILTASRLILQDLI